MSNKSHHPGKDLETLIKENGYTQREFSSKINIAYPLLNNILKGNRNININIALSLEAAGFETAEKWLIKQLRYSVNQAKQDDEIIRSNESIKTWSSLSKVVPLNYFLDHKIIGNRKEEAISKIYEIYGVKSVASLNRKIDNYRPAYFRKSEKFVQSHQNIFAWSLLAEYLARDVEVGQFSRESEKRLVSEIKAILYKNKDVISKTTKVLSKYGIKFFTLDRPSKTPVDGKSFMSNNNPTIVLSLKYKRLDNFAFTLMHELGHVFLHLTNPKSNYKEFFVNINDNDDEEFQADRFARNNLISPEVWDDFKYSNESFADDVILNFSEQIKVHPAIIRGRVCYENNSYYRKRTRINSINKLL